MNAKHLKNLIFKKTTSVTQTVRFVQPDDLIQQGNQAIRSEALCIRFLTQVVFCGSGLKKEKIVNQINFN